MTEMEGSTMGQWIGGFVPVLMCIAFALLVCFLVSRFLCGRTSCCAGWSHGPGAPGDSARAILNSRYARGEIRREEFERMKKEIREE